MCIRYTWIYCIKCFLGWGMDQLWLCFDITPWLHLQPALQMLTLKITARQDFRVLTLLCSCHPWPPMTTAVYRRASCWTCHPRLASRVCISSELPQPHSAEGNQQLAAATHYIWNTYTLIVPNLKKVIIDMGSKESYSKVQSTQLICLIYYFLLWKWLKRLTPPLHQRGIWIPSLPRLSL